jgi:hypothetical protein
LGTIPNVPNSLESSQLRTLCHGNHVDVPSSTKSSLPPFAFSGESLATSNRKSKRNRKRKNRKSKSPTFANHVGRKSHVTGIHTGNRYVASMSHVIDQSPTSASHVGYVQPTTAIHDGGTSLVNAIHMSDMSTTSDSHVGDKKPSSASHVGGIDYVEKPTWIGCKPKFPCKLCKGDHLTHLCHGIPEVRRLWSLSASSFDSESSLVSQQSIHYLVDEVIMPMQS